MPNSSLFLKDGWNFSGNSIGKKLLHHTSCNVGKLKKYNFPSLRVKFRWYIYFRLDYDVISLLYSNFGLTSV